MAVVRYGASNSTYRVEDTVSGRMTPTPPEPLAVIDLSSDMVVKLRLKVVAETVWAEAGATWRAMPASSAVMATDAVPSVLTRFEISM